MFYFIPGLYLPNTAATNRCMAYLHYLSEQKIETNVVFFSQNRQGDVMPSMQSIHVKNLWEKYLFKKGPLRYISMLVNLLLFRLRLKKGDIVYCYENVHYWKLFLKSGVRVFAEYTENPDVIGLGGKFLHTSKKRFAQCCKQLSGLFVISTSLKEYFIKLGVDNTSIHIINIIVDEMRFQGIGKDAETEPYIAYCGSAYNNKDGVDQLIQAFSLTIKDYPSVKLYIVGANPQKDQACSNEQLAKDLGLEKNVVFTGVVSAERMPQLLTNAKMLVLDRPRNIQAQYGFPTKLGEYLLTGNPTVLTRVGDMPLFLEDMVSTVFAEPDNPKDFSAKMVWCLKNEEEAKIIGRRGKEVALKHFSYKTETQKMIDIMFNDQ